MRSYVERKGRPFFPPVLSTFEMSGSLTLTLSSHSFDSFFLPFFSFTSFLSAFFSTCILVPDDFFHLFLFSTLPARHHQLGHLVHGSTCTSCTAREQLACKRRLTDFTAAAASLSHLLSRAEASFLFAFYQTSY